MTERLTFIFAFSLCFLFLTRPTFAQWEEEQKLSLLPGTFAADTDDEIGNSVCMDGNYAVVGVWQSDIVAGNAGAAIVYYLDGENWIEQAVLYADDGEENDFFGSAVSIAGNTIVVGALQDDDKGTNAGAAYVFKRDGTTWSFQQKLIAADGHTGQLFGNAVAISEGTIVIGGRSSNDIWFKSGAVYVFEQNGSLWNEQQKLTASDESHSDWFGNAVSVSGNTIIVGAVWNDDDGVGSGSAYIYEWNGSGWSEESKLLASDGIPKAAFGKSVAISGNVALVGAPGRDDLGIGSGAAYTFVRVDSQWQQQQKLLATDGGSGSEFGWSVSIDDTTLVVGARSDDVSADDLGAAYVYKRKSTWLEEQKLTASDGAFSDEFGYAVSVSGDAVIVGSRLDNDFGINSGSAYTFRWSPLSSIEKMEQETFTIGPNPSNGIFQVSTDIRNPFIGYQLIDMSGKILKEEVLDGGKAQIEFHMNLQSGVYVLRLNGKSSSNTQKIVIR